MHLLSGDGRNSAWPRIPHLCLPTTLARTKHSCVWKMGGGVHELRKEIADLRATFEGFRKALE